MDYAKNTNTKGAQSKETGNKATVGRGVMEKMEDTLL